MLLYWNINYKIKSFAMTTKSWHNLVVVACCEWLTLFLLGITAGLTCIFHQPAHYISRLLQKLSTFQWSRLSLR